MSERVFQAVVGAVGAGYFAFYLWLFVTIVSSPGDDNPVAMLALAAMALTLVPAYGLVASIRRRPLNMIWLGVSGFFVTVLSLIAWTFLD